jgi:hypothetical protein
MLLQANAEIKEPAADSDPMTTPKQTKGRKPKANLHNLPVGTGVKFGAMYIPLVKSYIGFQLPRNPHTRKTLDQCLWDKVGWWMGKG